MKITQPRDLAISDAYQSLYAFLSVTLVALSKMNQRNSPNFIFGTAENSYECVNQETAV